MTKPTDIRDREWLDVTIVTTWVDRGNVVQDESRVLKSDAEEEMTEFMRSESGNEELPRYNMPNHEFQGRVLRAIQTKLATPIMSPSKTTNEMRLLPPTAYREVIVRVNNLGKILEA